ncbi:MAG: inositol monophosphatase [Chloroflexi bacterium]|nr:inositol monophosphatase [Chloroflexota bacterium]
MSPIPLSRSGKSGMDIAMQAARRAGEIAVDGFSKARNVRQKSRGNVVTDVDLRAEKEIVGLLRTEYPHFNIMAEEGGGRETPSPYVWIVDPLDGSRNYASGLPIFCVSLALARDGDVVLGVTYDALRDEMFTAEKGKGAFLNATPICVGDKATLEESFVGGDLGYEDARGAQALELMQSIWPGVQGFRVIGSASLGVAYAAAGRFDLYFHNCVYPWDYAAGIVLVREAGGVITERGGAPLTLKTTGVVAANTSVHADFLRLAAGYGWEGT